MKEHTQHYDMLKDEAIVISDVDAGEATCHSRLSPIEEAGCADEDDVLKLLCWKSGDTVHTTTSI